MADDGGALHLCCFAAATTPAAALTVSLVALWFAVFICCLNKKGKCDYLVHLNIALLN